VLLYALVKMLGMCTDAWSSFSGFQRDGAGILGMTYGSVSQASSYSLGTENKRISHMNLYRVFYFVL
jgi:hypothetical protein